MNAIAALRATVRGQDGGNDRLQMVILVLNDSANLLNQALALPCFCLSINRFRSDKRMRILPQALACT